MKFILFGLVIVCVVFASKVANSNANFRDPQQVPPPGHKALLKGSCLMAFVLFVFALRAPWGF